MAQLSKELGELEPVIDAFKAVQQTQQVSIDDD
jgi:hypothetical protein